MNVRFDQRASESNGLHEEPDYRRLARTLGTVRTYVAGDVLFGDGEPPRCMYVVLKGEVEVLCGERVAGSIHEGQALGALSLLDVSPWLTAARAAGPCEVALLDEERFRALTEQKSNFILFVMQEFGSRATS